MPPRTLRSRLLPIRAYLSSADFILYIQQLTHILVPPMLYNGIPAMLALKPIFDPLCCEDSSPS